MELKFRELLKNIYKLINPKTTESFFKEDLKVLPAKEMLVYLLVIGLFTFLGYFLRYGFFSVQKYPEIAFKLSLVIYLIGYYIPSGVFLVFIMGFILYALSEKLLGKKIEKNEAISIIGYATMPQLMGGFFGIFLETMILHFLLMLYSIYLLFIGINVRFGFKHSLQSFLFIILTGFIFSTVLFILFVSILGIPSQYYGVG